MGRFLLGWLLGLGSAALYLAATGRWHERRVVTQGEAVYLVNHRGWEYVGPLAEPAEAVQIRRPLFSLFRRTEYIHGTPREPTERPSD